MEEALGPWACRQDIVSWDLSSSLRGLLQKSDLGPIESFSLLTGWLEMGALTPTPAVALATGCHHQRPNLGDP